MEVANAANNNATTSKTNTGTTKAKATTTTPTAGGTTSSDLTALLKDPAVAKDVLKMADPAAYGRLEGKEKRMNLLQGLGEVFSVDEWTDDAVRALQSWYDPTTGKPTPFKGALKTIGLPLDYVISGVRKVAGGAMGNKDVSRYDSPRGKDLIPQMIATGRSVFDAKDFQREAAVEGKAQDYLGVEEDMSGVAKFASGALGMALDTVATPSFWLSGSSSAATKLARKGTKTISEGFKEAGVETMKQFIKKKSYKEAQDLAAKALGSSGLEVTAESISKVIKSSSFLSSRLKETLPKGLYKVGPLTKGASMLKEGAVADTVARYIDNPLFAALGDVWGKVKGVKVLDEETIGSTMDDMWEGVRVKFTEGHAIKKYGGDVTKYHLDSLSNQLKAADYDSKFRQEAIAHHLKKLEETGNTDAINQAKDWITAREYMTGASEAGTVDLAVKFGLKDNPKEQAALWEHIRDSQVAASGANEGEAIVEGTADKAGKSLFGTELRAHKLGKRIEDLTEDDIAMFRAEDAISDARDYARRDLIEELYTRRKKAFDAVGGLKQEAKKLRDFYIKNGSNYSDDLLEIELITNAKPTQEGLEYLETLKELDRVDPGHIDMPMRIYKEGLEKARLQEYEDLVKELGPDGPYADGSGPAEANRIFDIETLGTVNNPIKGDIWDQKGVHVVTTNLGGVHGRGLAQQAKDMGLISKENFNVATSPKGKNVITLAVKGSAPETALKKGAAYSEKVTGKNLELLDSEINQLIEIAKKNPDKTFYMPYAGMGFGEGDSKEILPILRKVDAQENIMLVAKDESVLSKYPEAFKPGIRMDKESLQKLSNAGQLANEMEDLDLEGTLLESGFSKGDLDLIGQKGALDTLKTRHYLPRTQKFIDDYVRKNPKSLQASMFKGEGAKDLDRAYAHALATNEGELFKKLPEDLRNIWASQSAKDPEVGGLIKVGQEGDVHGSHWFNAQMEYDHLNDTLLDKVGNAIPAEWADEGGRFAPLDTKDYPTQILEHPVAGYPARTKANIEAADITLLFSKDMDGGSKLTADLAKKLNKPLISSADFTDTEQIAEALAEQIKKENPFDVIEINVAGNRLSKLGNMTQEQVNEKVFQIFKSVREKVGEDISFKIRSGGQTGIDEAAIKAGQKLGVPTTVLAPKGFVRLDGSGKEFFEKVFGGKVEKPAIVEGLTEVELPLDTYQRYLEVEELTKKAKSVAEFDIRAIRQKALAPQLEKLNAEIAELDKVKEELTADISKNWKIQELRGWKQEGTLRDKLNKVLSSNAAMVRRSEAIKERGALRGIVSRGIEDELNPESIKEILDGKYGKLDPERRKGLQTVLSVFQERDLKETRAVRELQDLISEGFTPEASEKIIKDPYGAAKFMRDEAELAAYQSYIPYVRKNKRWFLAGEMMMEDMDNYKEEVGPLGMVKLLNQRKLEIQGAGQGVEKYAGEIAEIDAKMAELYKENPLLKYIGHDGDSIDMTAFFNEHPGFVALDNKTLRKELSLYKKDIANMDALKGEETHLLLKRESLTRAISNKEIAVPSQELKEVNEQLNDVAARKVDLVSRKAQLDLQKEFRQLPQRVADFKDRQNYKGYKFTPDQKSLAKLRESYYDKVSDKEVERLTQNQIGRDFFGAKVSEIEGGQFDPLDEFFKASGVDRDSFSVNDFAYYADELADDAGYVGSSRVFVDDLGNFGLEDDLTESAYYSNKVKLEKEIADLEKTLKTGYSEEIVSGLEEARRKYLTNELLKNYSRKQLIGFFGEEAGKSSAALWAEATSPYKEVGSGKVSAKGFALSKWKEVEDTSLEPSGWEKYLDKVGKRELFAQKKKFIKLIKQDLVTEAMESVGVKGVDEKMKFAKEAEEVIDQAFKDSPLETGGIPTEAEEKMGELIVKAESSIKRNTRITELNDADLTKILDSFPFEDGGKKRILDYIAGYRQEVARQEQMFNEMINPWLERTLLPEDEKLEILEHFKGLKGSSLLDMSKAENRKEVLSHVLELEKKFQKIAETGDARDKLASRTMQEVFLRPMKEHAANYLRREKTLIDGKPLGNMGLLGVGHRSLDVPEKIGDGVGNVITQAKRKYATQAALEGYNAIGVADPIKMKTDLESTLKDVIGYQIKEEGELLAFHENMANLVSDLKMGKGGEGIRIAEEGEVLDPATWKSLDGIPGLAGQGVYVTKELKPEFDLLTKFWKKDEVKGFMKYVRFLNNLWKGVQTGTGVNTRKVSGKLYEEAKKIGMQDFADFYNEQAAFVPLSPAFTFRNTIGNLTASVLKGEIPIKEIPNRISEAVEIQKAIMISEGATEFNQGLLGVLKSKIPKEQLDDLVEEVQKSGLLTETQVGNELIQNPEVQNKFLGKMTEALTENRAMKFNNNQELIWKIAIFRNARQSGKSITDAVKTVNQALFDYSALTPFEQEYIRPYTVFYTWTKKNVELMADLMINEPQKFKAYAKLLMEAPSQLSNSTEEEKSRLPKWTEGILGIPMTIGGETRFISGFGGNLESFMEVLGANGKTFGEQVKGGALNAVDMLAPTFKLPFNLAVTGQNTFKGMPISEDTSAYGYRALPSFMKKALGISEKQWVDKNGNVGTTYRMDGEKKYAIESSLGRASTVPLKVLSMFSGEDKPVAGLLDLALGLKTTRYDTAYLKYKTDKEKTDALMKELERLGLLTQYTGYGYNSAGAQMNQPLVDEYLKSLQMQTQ